MEGIPKKKTLRERALERIMEPRKNTPEEVEDEMKAVYEANFPGGIEPEFQGYREKPGYEEWKAENRYTKERFENQIKYRRNPDEAKKILNWLILLVIVIVLAILGAIGYLIYYFFFRESYDNDDEVG